MPGDSMKVTIAFFTATTDLDVEFKDPFGNLRKQHLVAGKQYSIIHSGHLIINGVNVYEVDKQPFDVQPEKSS